MQAVSRNPGIIDQLERYSEIFLKFNEFESGKEEENFYLVLANPEGFDENLRRLRACGLADQAEYVGKVVDNPAYENVVKVLLETGPDKASCNRRLKKESYREILKTELAATGGNHPLYCC